MADSGDFDEINVQRLNVREPDGRLRYVLANRDRLPGAIIRGHEHPPHRTQAGMLFYSDEETENGGLTFGGADGESGGGLSFDAYEQDQIVQIFAYDTPSSTTAGMVVNQTPSQPIAEQIREVEEIRSRPDGEEVLDRMRAEGAFGHRRLFVGMADGDAVLDLRDGAGKPRLRLQVTEDGAASIEFLDENGAVVNRIGE